MWLVFIWNASLGLNGLRPNQTLLLSFLRKKLTTRSRWLFTQKSSVIDVWGGPKYASTLKINLLAEMGLCWWKKISVLKTKPLLETPQKSNSFCVRWLCQVVKQYRNFFVPVEWLAFHLFCSQLCHLPFCIHISFLYLNCSVYLEVYLFQE